MTRYAITIADLLTIGLLLGSTAIVWGTTYYVDISNITPSAPYTDWVTAATNIQDAVDAAVGGETVMVSNSAYAASSNGRPPSAAVGIPLCGRTIFQAVSKHWKRESSPRKTAIPTPRTTRKAKGSIESKSK